MGMLMGQSRVEDAIQRIEQALSRIERAADDSPTAPATGGDDRLREAHDRLRSRVEEAVNQIDALLGSGERA